MQKAYKQHPFAVLLRYFNYTMKHSSTNTSQRQSIMVKWTFTKNIDPKQFPLVPTDTSLMHEVNTLRERVQFSNPMFSFMFRCIFLL